MTGSPFGAPPLAKILAPSSHAIVALIALQSLQHVLLILWSYVPVIMVKFLPNLVASNNINHLLSLTATMVKNLGATQLRDSGVGSLMRL